MRAPMQKIINTRLFLPFIRCWLPATGPVAPPLYPVPAAGYRASPVLAAGYLAGRSINK